VNRWDPDEGVLLLYPRLVLVGQTAKRVLD